MFLYMTTKDFQMFYISNISFENKVAWAFLKKIVLPFHENWNLKLTAENMDKRDWTTTI